MQGAVRSLAMAGFLALGLASSAVADDDLTMPRSSAPSGFRPDQALPATMSVAPGPSGAQGGAVGQTGGGGANRAAGPAGDQPGTVRIQGNTSINVTNQNVDTSASGKDNRSCARLGGIGECGR